jgi:dTDP-glucose 4,6-dehydratase
VGYQRTLLVTGGAGFIGASFVAHHFQAHPHDQIIVLDALTYAGSLERLPGHVRESERFRFVQGSVRSPQVVPALLAEADVVVHFAAETHVPRSISDNLAFFETDVLGTQALASQVLACHDRIERFIHISSSEVYGTAESEEMDEEHPLRPSTPYAAAKCAADRLIYSFVQTYGLPAVIVRPFNNYGPGQHLEKLVARFIANALLGDPLSIHGDGTAARDWIFVDDTCDAIERVLDAPLADVRGEAFNVGTGRATDVLTIARKVVELTGGRADSIVHTRDRPGQVRLHRAHTGKIRQRLDFQPRVSLEQGLEATVRWYRDNRDWWQRQLWMRAVPITDGSGSISYW